MNGAELLIQELENHGVTQIFGIPGDETSVFRALKKSKIQFITTRHEQGAAFMADAYARVSGKVGICYSTLGPGATNLITGITNAFLDRSPVVAFSDQVELSEIHKGAHQYVDLPKLFEPITKWTATVEDTDTIPQVVDYAMQVALKERPGPVHLSLPRDVLRRSVFMFSAKSKAKPILTRKKLSPDINSIKLIHRYLKDSLSPIMILGNLVKRKNLTSAVTSLIEHFSIPVFTSYMGKGAIPESHPLSLGVLSRHAKGEVSGIFSRADLVLLVGFDYAEGVKPGLWRVGREKKVVSFDENVLTEGIFYRPDAVISHSVDRALGSLVKLDRKSNAVGVQVSWLDVARAKKEMSKKLKSRISHQKGKIAPDVVLSTISKVVKGEVLITADVGLNKYAVGLTYPTDDPQSTLFSNGLSSMGFSLPAAIGAKIANPKKKIISISGDGGLMMNIQELETCQRQGLKIIFIVLRDGSLGLIKRMQQNEFQSHLGVDFTNPNFVSLAKAFKIKGASVKTAREFDQVLVKALKDSESWLIDVPITYEGWLE